jgi:LPS-assembly lipoprotein
MWFCDRRWFLTGLAAFAATGCRFEPVYAPGGTGPALMGTVRADDPVTRADYRFVAALEERLGRPVAARYALAYRIDIRQIEAGAVRGIGATRIQLQGGLDFTLTAVATGAEIARGQIDAESSYSTTSTQLATLAAAEDAELRLMRMLADGLIARLMTEPGLRGG